MGRGAVRHPPRIFCDDRAHCRAEIVGLKKCQWEPYKRCGVLNFERKTHYTLTFRNLTTANTRNTPYYIHCISECPPSPPSPGPMPTISMSPARRTLNGKNAQSLANRITLHFKPRGERGEGGSRTLCTSGGGDGGIPGGKAENRDQNRKKCQAFFMGK